jgi:hypothetical protein
MPLLTGGKYLQGFITFFTALAFRLKRDWRRSVRDGIWVSEAGNDLFGIRQMGVGGWSPNYSHGGIMFKQWDHKVENWASSGFHTSKSFWLAHNTFVAYGSKLAATTKNSLFSAIFLTIKSIIFCIYSIVTTP